MWWTRSAHLMGSKSKSDIFVFNCLFLFRAHKFTIFVNAANYNHKRKQSETVIIAHHFIPVHFLSSQISLALLDSYLTAVCEDDDDINIINAGYTNNSYWVHSRINKH